MSRTDKDRPRYVREGDPFDALMSFDEVSRAWRVAKYVAGKLPSDSMSAFNLTMRHESGIITERQISNLTITSTVMVLATIGGDIMGEYDLVKARTAMDNTDDAIIKLIRVRNALSRHIRERKVAEGLSQTDLTRESFIIAKYREALGPQGADIAHDLLPHT